MKVTDWLNEELLGAETRASVVVAAGTVTLDASVALAVPKLVSWLYVAAMVWGDVTAVISGSEQTASHRVLPPEPVPLAEADTAEQVGLAAPLSVNATVPLRAAVPEGAVMLASKARGTAWFTVPEVEGALKVMVIEAVPTVCVTVLAPVEKLFALSV